ncbi:MAG: hypothetical protein LQ351_005766 [Letrouitia transgressa]|nr:MAG: hypothetical protein LQ351_005766 [Letrouitia transgressa]
MGVKPPLPAPTESSTLQTSGGSVTGTDLATDVSRRTDKSSFSIPEDGSPVTISTKKRRDHHDKEHDASFTKASHHSQTSLLIEYFEGGKGPSVHTRPSVRVKVTPSAARKIKDTNEHIQITEASGNRKPSYTRRISLGPQSSGERQIAESADDRSISSYTSAAEESHLARGHPPVEIEVMRKGEGSELSAASVPREKQYINQNASEISSIPPDSMLDENAGSLTPKRTRSRSISRDAVVNHDNTLKTPSRRRSRSLSRERLAQKVVEKLGSRPKEVSSGKGKSSSKVRSRSVSQEQMKESTKPSKRRGSRHHYEETFQSGESALTDSQLSPKRQSGDQYSFRSGTSKSSYTNPKLLETVEDTIRRLILPELTALRHEQKMQKNREKFERGHRESFASNSSASHNEITRRVSKHASAPDVKPKVVLNQDESNAGVVLSGNSIKGRKESRRERVSDSPSDSKSQRDVSAETVIRDEKVSRKKSKDGHRLKDAAAAGIAGGVLTAAALRHHDSKSSVESRERRRRRRSKSHSRSASIAESTEDIFYKHDVPPMPMRSDIHSSELTRDSLLSERTEGPPSPSAEQRRKEIREVSRGSPREVLSPASRTPNRTPFNSKNLATHHSNLSREDLSLHSAPSDQSLSNANRRSQAADLGTVGVDLAAAETLQEQDNHPSDTDEDGFLRDRRNRALSPIQSVASYREEIDIPHEEALHQTHSSGSISSLDKQNKDSGLSIKSLSSVASTSIARSNRPKGINLESTEDVIEQHEGLRTSTITQSESPSRDHAVNEWYGQQHEDNERYRQSTASPSDPRIDFRHLTNYTDDSMDAPYLDKVTDGQHIQDIGANPEYIHTPVAVESAVASLHDPSVLSVRSKLGNKSISDFEEVGREHGQYEGSQSSLKHDFDRQGYKYNDGLGIGRLSIDKKSPMSSPRQSVARSIGDQDEEFIQMGASGLPQPDDPLPEIGHNLDSESDLNTNPSIIQGPIGGINHDNRDHWPYQETPPHSKNEFPNQSSNTSAQQSLKAVAADLLNRATLQSQDKDIIDGQARDVSFKENEPPVPKDRHEQGINHDFGYHNQHVDPIPTPPMNKDEGYVSAAYRPSPGPLSPESNTKSPGIFEDPGINIEGGLDDPFVGKHARHLSGFSQGMPSPLYNSATGGGIDRIQSKDIVALMDHLTVRDAQRNARDTEILVTLVRSAAEMRNSFEDMKRFIAEQDDMIIDSSGKQHERTVQKVIGGPRPQPLGTSRAPRRPSTEDELEDIPTKRRNVFKRALKGLSGRSGNDLSKIEDMLFQLLGDVEDLKAAQGIVPAADAVRPESRDTYGNPQDIGDGYEPEGQAGTSSTGNHSGYFSNPPSRQGNAMRSQEGRRGSQNRISTVLEGDEELEAHEQDMLNNQFEDENLSTPTKENARAGSVPLATPPQVRLPTGAQSNEHTPKTSTEKSRKHKSNSSSFFPRISRWSKTTSSSMGDTFRSPRQQQRPQSEESRSGSDVHYNADEHHDPQGDDRLRSNDSLANDPINPDAGRPRSPLVPSHISDDPKYQAHRNSLNLQHPQPRPGPTHRFQTQLESQAHNFGSPISPSSDQFGSNPSLARFMPTGSGNRHSGGAGYLSPISDAGMSETSSVADRSRVPPRPPKIPDDEPLIPARPPKVQQLSQERVGEGAIGSPRRSSSSAKRVQQQRKPTGPRPITGSGSWSPDKVANLQRQRYRGSPNHVESSSEDVALQT